MIYVKLSRILETEDVKRDIIIRDQKHNEIQVRGIDEALTLPVELMDRRVVRYEYSDHEAHPIRITVAGSMEGIFICSQANEAEKPGKKKFVTDHYGVLENHIYFVQESLGKLDSLREIHRTWFPWLCPEMIVLIDDTVKILNHVQENSQFATVHISSFLE